jgi:hypothetical protein
MKTSFSNKLFLCAAALVIGIGMIELLALII